MVSNSVSGAFPNMSTPPMSVRKGATYADLLEAPEDYTAELIDGDLYLQPRPSVPHQTAVGALFSLLRVTYELGRGGPGGWWILPEVELHLDDDVLVPDLSGWYQADLTIADRTEAYIAQTPRWVCEVLSKGTKTYDRGRKMLLYRQLGIRHVWLVDPARACVEVFDFVDVRTDPIMTLWQNAAEDGIGQVVQSFRAPPFDAVEIGMDELFPTTAVETR